MGSVFSRAGLPIAAGTAFRPGHRSRFRKCRSIAAAEPLVKFGASAGIPV